MLKRIRIEGLFDLHDVEIDLEKRLNILIGENGIGKTTILKLLYALSLDNPVELSKFFFRKIILFKQDIEIIIDYCVLFPDADYIIDRIIIDDELVTNDNLISLVKNFVSDLKGYNKKSRFQYCRLLSICYNQELNVAADKLENMNGKHLAVEHFSFNSVGEIKRILKENWFSNDFYDIKDFSIFRLYEVGLINLNMVIDYKYIDNTISKGFLSSNLLSWLSSYYSFSYNNLSAKDEIDFMLKSKIIFEGDHDTIGFNYIPSKFKDEYVALLKKVYENIQFKPRYLDDELTLMRKTLSSSDEIDINRIINRYFYDLDFLKYINNKAIESFIEIIGSKSDNIFTLDNQVTQFLTKDVLFDIKHFIKPILAEGTLYYDLIEALEEELYKEFTINEKVFQHFISFYNENIDMIKERKSSQIQVLEELLNIFVVNKSINIFPSGIVFHPKKLIKRRGKFKVLINDKSIIPISELSSGERKILTILVISIFYSDSTLLIDEPELSLSLTWQEKLLPLLIEKTDINRIIIATHSPYLISNKYIEDAIVPLPLEENDEFE